MNRRTLGRYVLSGVALSLIPGGFLADWNRTHLFNPRWPPHAKFHDAWTILLAASLGGTAMYLLWRRKAEPEVAAALMAQVAGTQAVSFLVPGTGGVRKEFPRRSDRPGLAKLPEWMASTALLLATAAGWWLSRGSDGNNDIIG
jgi:hypothetical protein